MCKGMMPVEGDWGRGRVGREERGAWERFEKRPKKRLSAVISSSSPRQKRRDETRRRRTVQWTCAALQTNCLVGRLMEALGALISIEDDTCRDSAAGPGFGFCFFAPFWPLQARKSAYIRANHALFWNNVPDHRVFLRPHLFYTTPQQPNIPPPPPPPPTIPHTTRPLPRPRPRTRPRHRQRHTDTRLPSHARIRRRAPGPVQHRSPILAASASPSESRSSAHRGYRVSGCCSPSRLKSLQSNTHESA